MLDPKTLQNGNEQFESFIARISGKRSDRVQYDYRAKNGKLFSCVAISLESARQRRDKWLQQNNLVA